MPSSAAASRSRHYSGMDYASDTEALQSPVLSVRGMRSGIRLYSTLLNFTRLYSTLLDFSQLCSFYSFFKVFRVAEVMVTGLIRCPGHFKEKLY